MKKTIVLGALLASLTTSAYSLPLETIGKPHSALATMQAEGRHVDIKEGLRMLIPSAFRTLVHRDVLLPAHINWKTGQDWVSALETMAREEHLTVKIDWTRDIVYIEKDKDPKAVVEKLVGPTIDDLIRKESPVAEKPESPSIQAVETVAKLTEQPAPVTVAEVKAQPSKGSEQTPEEQQAVAKSMLTSAPVVASAPAPAPTPAPVAKPVEVPKVQVTAQPEVVNKQPMPVVKESGSENKSIDSFMVPEALSLSSLMRSVAKAHSAEVVNYAQDAQLSSALIPPGLDLGEDLSLIHRALGGSDAPVSIRVYRRSEVFEVVPAAPGQARFEVEMKVPYSGPLTKRQMPVYPRH